jgi:hypothetical protein
MIIVEPSLTMQHSAFGAVIAEPTIYLHDLNTIREIIMDRICKSWLMFRVELYTIVHMLAHNEMSPYDY